MRTTKLDFGTPNPVQRKAIEAFRNGKRIVLINTGRQAGKSHYGARWLITQTMNPQATHKLAAAVAPTYRMARVLQRKLEEVLQSDPELWKRITHRKQPIPTYHFPNGWTIEVHSSDDPDSLRGPTFDAVWYDEVAKGSEDSFDIVMATLLATRGKFLGTTTPRGKQNWIYRKLYLKSVPPGEPDHNPDLYNSAYATITGSSWDNAENLSVEAVQELEDQYGAGSIFGRQEISGEFVSFEGLVYAWSESNYLPIKEFPKIGSFSHVIGGVDFGWTDPAAAFVLGYKEGVWWVIDGIYESRLEPNDFAQYISQLGETYKVSRWYADSARPDAIADLNSRGLPVLPVVKPKIEDRIREMAMFTDNHRFKVSHRCPDVRNELQTYQYPDPSRLERDKQRNPIDRNNHALDSIGYAIWSMRWLWRNDASYSTKDSLKDGKDDPDDESEFVSHPRIRKGPKGPAGLYGG
jgi:phage terminase large subunit-like protein